MLGKNHLKVDKALESIHGGFVSLLSKADFSIHKIFNGFNMFDGRFDTSVLHKIIYFFTFKFWFLNYAHNKTYKLIGTKTIQNYIVINKFYSKSFSYRRAMLLIRRAQPISILLG